MMTFVPYLTFNGQCEAAFKLYEKCFGGKITFMATYAGSPMENDVPPEWRSKIMHATLKIGDQVIQGADAPGKYEKSQGFSISIALSDPAEAERIYKALSENAEIGMELQETFWAQAFAELRDQFGIHWSINCEKVAEGQAS